MKKRIPSILFVLIVMLMIFSQFKMVRGRLSTTCCHFNLQSHGIVVDWYDTSFLDPIFKMMKPGPNLDITDPMGDSFFFAPRCSQNDTLLPWWMLVCLCLPFAIWALRKKSDAVRGFPVQTTNKEAVVDDSYDRSPYLFDSTFKTKPVIGIKSLIASFLIVLIAATSASATYPVYTALPYSYTSSPGTWAALWTRAKTQVVRMSVLGDSQETDPSGLGIYYVPNLQLEFAKRFGSAGTQLTCFWSNTTWGQKDTAPGDGTYSATSLTTSQLLPNANPVALNYTNITTQTPFLGYLVNGRFDNTDGGQGNLIADPLLVNAKAFDPTGGVYAEMYLATRSSSNQVAWNYLPRANGYAFYYDTVVSSGSSNIAGLSSGSYSVFRYTTPLLTYDSSKPFPQITIAAKNNDGTKVEFLGMRWLSAAHPSGVLIDTWSAGGFTATSIPSGYASCAPLVQAMTNDVMLLHYGANDATAGITAAQFQTNVTALIAFMRTAAANPALKFILCIDPSRMGMTTGQQTEYDQYAGALYAIAQADPNCYFVNTRRMTEDAAFKVVPAGNPTISIASPGVITMANNFVLNNAVTFSTTGALPTGLTAGQTYYVISAGLSGSSFEVSATPAGAAVNTSGSQSGTVTCSSTVTYSIDGVHHNVSGGRLVAQCDVAAIMGTAVKIQSGGIGLGL